jgi:hypothetical protein
MKSNSKIKAGGKLRGTRRTTDPAYYQKTLRRAPLINSVVLVLTGRQPELEKLIANRARAAVGELNDE